MNTKFSGRWSFSLILAVVLALLLAPAVWADNGPITGVFQDPVNNPPTIVISGASNGTYQFGSVPRTFCQVTDVEDGNSVFPAIVDGIFGPLAQYGLGYQTATCYYRDFEGLEATASVTYQIVDVHKPVITDLGPTAPPDGANGWYISPVTNQFRAEERGAGFLDFSHEMLFTQSSGAAEGIAVKINSRTVSDAFGSVAEALDSAPFMIDLTNPIVAFSGGPVDGGIYYEGLVPAAPTCSASDTISGVALCTISGYETGVGSHTLIATAVDNAGRSASASATYTVLALQLAGFYNPVAMGSWNTVKGGSTVPLKFQIIAGSTALVDTALIDNLTITKISCSNGVDEKLISSIGPTELRNSGGQFKYNWKTPRDKGSCYSVTAFAINGATLNAWFKIK